MSGNKIQIYDTTLRDGSQGEGISFSVQDKILIAKKIDEIGFDFIEGGWPGANPKDVAFFEEAKKLKFRRAELVAFGSTCKARAKASEDENLRGLLGAGTAVITLFGKSWDLHVREVFRVELEENLRMISDSVRFLRSEGRRVIYDAEHFFDGYARNREYALKTLGAAADAGAETLVLCDTNGGTLPSAVAKAVSDVRAKLKTPLGIHTHNDCGMGIANAIAALEAGAVHVQGTVNGYGERCGNPDLLAIVANIELKLGSRCLEAGKLKELTEVSRYVSEVSNMLPAKNQPYVGASAFAHKGGVHIDAVKKNPETYEHIDPALVGNQRRSLVSEVGGRANVLLKAEELGVDLKKESPQAREIAEEVKRREYEGYQYEAAEASLELLMRKVMGKRKVFFTAGASVSQEKLGGEDPNVKARVEVKVDGKVQSKDAAGDGPVNALDKAFREALSVFYPAVKTVRLDDYKVRIVDSKSGTAAKVRVFIESTDGKRAWTTVGVSTNILEASWEALVEAYEFKLLRSS
ncbi:MAG: citramalate synthase [Candidatus Omnitrophica bacterium]|nr:citramalate synthase [Candidatus Omnitrophota bacterium]